MEARKRNIEKLIRENKKEVDSKGGNKLDINSLKGSLENVGVTKSEVAVEIGELSGRAKSHSQDIESIKKDEQGGEAI